MAVISWRSIFAGLLVAFLSLAIFLSLGLAFGGAGLVEDGMGNYARVFTGVWFLGSSVLALFVGSYFAARLSKFHTGRIGSAQGVLITALFFGVLFVQGVVGSDVEFQTAEQIRGMGWSAFATLVSSILGAVSGGHLGSRTNLKHPLTREQLESVEDIAGVPV